VTTPEAAPDLRLGVGLPTRAGVHRQGSTGEGELGLIQRHHPIGQVHVGGHDVTGGQVHHVTGDQRGGGSTCHCPSRRTGR
jgi:hypothetical protein